MKLNQFRYLAAVEKYGSISKAAKELYVSQPSISMAIRDLEEELGVQILNRSQQGIEFTEDGLKVMESVRTIMTEVEHLSHLVEEKQNNQLRGTCSIGGTSYFTDSLLLKVIVDMRSSFPDLHIRLEENDSYNILNRINNCSLDLGVIMHSSIDEELFEGTFRSYHLRTMPLFEDEMCFVIGSQHPLADRESAPLAEILSYPVIQFRSSMNNVVMQLFQRFRKDLDVLYIEDFSSLWRLPLIGDYAFLSPAYAFETKKLPGLKLLRISDMDYKVTVSCVHPNTMMSEAEKEIVYRLQKEGSRMMKHSPFE